MWCVMQEVAAESAAVQKQVDIWHQAKQCRDDMSAWLSSMLTQLREAVEAPRSTAVLLKLITCYHVSY